MADIIEFAGRKNRGVGLGEGEILSENVEGLFEVLMDNGPIWMRKCDSCLLKPEVGDKVIVAILDNMAAILSVLNAKNKERVLDLGQAATIKAACLNFHSQNYTLTSNYVTESIQYAKIIKSNLLLKEIALIQIKTNQFSIN